MMSKSFLDAGLATRSLPATWTLAVGAPRAVASHIDLEPRPLRVATAAAAMAVFTYAARRRRDLVPRLPCRSASTAHECFERPRVLFVLGGPGSGKGTQSERILRQFDSWAHVSAGDCLRAERENSNSKDGELIDSIIREGRIVPVEITVRLLQQAMAKIRQSEGKTNFLIDGFPRNLDNFLGWQSSVGSAGCELLGAFFYEVNNEVLERRLRSRGETSGRSDDNLDSIRKRLKTYNEVTAPLLQHLEATGCRVFRVDAAPSIDAVWTATDSVIRGLDAD